MFLVTTEHPHKNFFGSFRTTFFPTAFNNCFQIVILVKNIKPKQRENLLSQIKALYRTNKKEVFKTFLISLQLNIAILKG